MTANAHRGEVTVTFEGQEFVLRPSQEAILAAEHLTGLSLLELTRSCEDGALSLDRMAAIATEFIKAWGKQTGDKTAAAVTKPRIGELIYSTGVLQVLPRLTLVLQYAVMGGCNPDGTLKEGEMTTTETVATTVVGSQE